MKICISTSTFGSVGGQALERLKKSGLEVLLNPYGRRLTAPELLELIQGATGLIAGTERLDDSIFTNAQALRVISRCGSGLDTVDMEAAKRRRITVLNTPDAPVQGVAELTLGLLLGALRRAHEADRVLRQGTWKPLMGQLLYGKTVGLIGLGRIGRRMVEILKPFNVKILAREKRPDRAFVKRHGIQLTSLNPLLRRADVVSLHVTLDPETRGMIGVHELALMKPSGILVNTSRGELVDDNALAAALQNNRLRAAGMDVFEVEPYKGPLLSCANAFLTCHMGSYAAETRVHMEEEAVDNLLRALKTLKP